MPRFFTAISRLELFLTKWSRSDIVFALSEHCLFVLSLAENDNLGFRPPPSKCLTKPRPKGVRLTLAAIIIFAMLCLLHCTALQSGDHDAFWPNWYAASVSRQGLILGYSNGSKNFYQPSLLSNVYWIFNTMIWCIAHVSDFQIFESKSNHGLVVKSTWMKVAF